MYGLLFGRNPTHLLLPMLNKHDGYFARFRDVFTADKDDYRAEGDQRRKIYVYTRTGGGNREEYETDIEEQSAYPGFLYEYDDTYDSTYMTFVYEVPECWHADYDRVEAQDYENISDEYKRHAQTFYTEPLKWTFGGVAKG